MKHDDIRLTALDPELPTLTDIETGSADRVGHKALDLALLRRAGFTTPPGVVVPIGVEIGEAHRVTITSALGHGPFAVRSSAAREDRPDSSQAGQYLTRLDVPSDGLIAAIVDVQRSGPSMAVLIQPMLEPECSGVAFTADPITGDRSVIRVVATTGVADRLLSGAVAGDEWEVRGRKANPLRRPQRIARRRLIRRVAAVAGSVADSFGDPRDVEWVWDGGTLWLVQARPVTALPEAVDWTPPHPGVYHRSLRFGEWIPEPVTPLFESWLLTRMEHRLHEWIGEQVGQVAPEPHHVVVNGWYYYSLNWLPAPGVALWKNAKSIIPRLPKTWRRASAMFPQTVRHGYHIFEEEWRRDILPRYLQAVDEANQRVESADPRELVDIVDTLADLAGLYFASIAVVAGSGYKFEAQLATFWGRHLRDALDVSHLELLAGLDHSRLDTTGPLLESLDWWIPPARGASAVTSDPQLADRRIAVQAKAERVLSRSPRRLAKFQRLVADAQAVNPVREEQLALLGLPWPVMRRAVERLGEHLADQGRIEQPNEVFFLRRDELDRLLGGGSSAPPVEERRRSRERSRRLVAPLSIGPQPWIVRFMFASTNKAFGAVRSEHALVHGVPASPGRVTGPVKIVRNSADFDSVEPGDVVVAPITAPAWTVLFGRAAAIVTDVGNALAHASIIAREYGIPAVVGCGDATARLADGQMVTVDGSRGTVEPAS